MMVNAYILPIIHVELASLIKELCIDAGKFLVENPIKKIPLAIQQRADQLAIIPLIHHSGQARGGGKGVVLLMGCVGRGESISDSLMSDAFDSFIL